MSRRLAVALRASAATLLLGCSPGIALALTAGPATAQDTTVDPATSTTAVPTAAGSSFLEDGVRITRGVVTADAGGVPLTVDIYQPEEAGTGRPAVVLVHGGAWFQGAPSDMDVQGKLLAEQGWVGFSVSYRLAAPGTPTWPQALTDVQRQVRWVGANAQTYGADPTRIAMIGASAGAHLATLVASLGTTDMGTLTGTPSDDPNPPVPVRAIASWSAPTDLVDLAGIDGNPPTGCGENVNCQVFWELPFVENFLGCLPADCPATYTQASPMSWAKPETTPVWLANSTEELVPIGQLQALASAFAAADVDHTVRILEGAGHGQDYTDAVWNDMTPWLAERLGVPAPNPIQFPAEGSGLTTQIVMALVALTALVGVVGGSVWAVGRAGPVPTTPEPAPTPS